MNGTMYCPNCGTANPDDSTFCSSCGASLKASSPAEPSLGASVNPTPGETRIDEMKAVLKNAIALVRNPVAYMTTNKDQVVSLNSLMINYVAILALIPLVGRLIGDLVFYSGSGVGYAIAGSIVSYILDIIAVFVVGIIIWKLGPSFQTSTTQSKATVLAAFVYTPVFLIGILNIVPVLGYLALLGLLYGLYILYKGLPILLNTPADKRLIYVVAILVVSFIIEFVISLLIGGLDGAAHTKSVPASLDIIKQALLYG